MNRNVFTANNKNIQIPQQTPQKIPIYQRNNFNTGVADGPNGLLDVSPNVGLAGKNRVSLSKSIKCQGNGCHKLDPEYFCRLCKVAICSECSMRAHREHISEHVLDIKIIMEEVAKMSKVVEEDFQKLNNDMKQISSIDYKRKIVDYFKNNLMTPIKIIKSNVESFESLLNNLLEEICTSYDQTMASECLDSLNTLDFQVKQGKFFAL